MSMNNIIPAWLILDQIKQEQLSREEYLEWLRAEAEKQPHDPLVKARLEVEEAVEVTDRNIMTDPPPQKASIEDMKAEDDPAGEAGGGG